MSKVYLRYPDVCGENLVFVADNDIWLAGLVGGQARRLTSDHVPVSNPRFSPDGTKVAWTSAREGTPDAWVFDTASGAISRLTWWGRGLVVGWRDNDQVVIASGHQEVARGTTRLYLVNLDGTTEKLALGPAGAGAWHGDGRLALTTPNFREAPFWKRYRGGTASRLWIQQGDGGWLKALPEVSAGINGPNWVENRVIFCSDLLAGGTTITDPSAQAQLFSVDASGGDLRQHTNHNPDQGYVRDPRSDGQTIVYHARGRLYAMAGCDATPREIDIDLGITVPNPRTVSPTDNLTTIAPDHQGNGSLITWEGATYYLTHRAGPARALSVNDAVRFREAVVLGSTGLGAWVSDANGEDSLEIVPLEGLGSRRQLATGQLGYVLHLAASPNGKYLATSSHDGAVRLVSVDDDTVQLIDDSRHGEVATLAWSPDSRYLVWSAPLGAYTEPRLQLRLFDTQAEGEPTWVALTSGTFADCEPVFTRDGKYLAWISWRTFDPRYNNHSFDLSFNNSARPWLAPIQASEPLPFGVSADGWALSPPEAAKTKKTGKKAKPAKDDPTTIQFDVDGFEARAVALPVPSGEYAGLRAIKDGLTWLRYPGGVGELGSIWAGVAGDRPTKWLERFSFETRRLETLVDKADSYEVSGNGEILVIRHRDEVTAQPTRRVDGDDDANIRVDLSRLRRKVVARTQWSQMLDEQARLMALHFWREDLDGSDWAGILARYRPTVERLLTRSDLFDLMAETVAELNTSHAYVIPPAPAKTTVGFLGAEVTIVDDGFHIDRILPGDSSDPEAWQPLRRAGVDARVGDIIIAIDGQPAPGAPSLGALLEGAAGKSVELVLRRDGEDRRVGVVPLPNEDALRYHAWVAGRAARVEQISNGRLGYLHVPNMAAVGW
ncbi:MAG: PDZ domain-containing protein, partial [Propionibacteriaceae bacterium]|nr:PDZ domain-containing protein [Propionibacteriaceae bacterium]